jgi:phosphate acetyltransferase
MMKGSHHQELVEKTRGLAPIRTAVVHPVDTVSLLGAVEAAKEKLIIPVLVGPETKIRAAAEQAKLDLSSYELVPTEHSHAAAAQAVALARDRKVEALMKGSLHTDEFMGAIVHEEKLHTARRMSHVFVIDAPDYPRPFTLLRYVRLRDAGLGSLRRGRSCKRKGVGFGCDLTSRGAGLEGVSV